MANTPVSRRWTFTSFNTLASFDVLFNDFAEEGVIYCVAQLEIGEQEHEHVQGYIHFNKAVRFSLVKRLIQDNTAHCEVARGSAEENRDYCTKESDRIDGPWTFGTIAKCGRGVRTDIEEFARTLEDTGDFEGTVIKNPGVFFKYGNNCVKYNQIIQKRRQHRCGFNKPRVIVYTGTPGTGKSRRVREKEKPEELFTVPPQQRDGGGIWFDGYSGEPAILLEDFESEIGFRFFLRLLDGYPGEQFPIKGGFVYKQWRRIYITSNIPISLWYGRSTIKDQPPINSDGICPPAIKRRLDEVWEFDAQRAIQLF